MMMYKFRKKWGIWIVDGNVLDDFEERFREWRDFRDLF